MADNSPPLQRPSTPFCKVPLMQDQVFANGAVPYFGTFSPPPDCPRPWAMVALDWWGSVDNNQLDRAAGLWIGQSEIFRETTPIGRLGGIAWHVEKDVSEYSSLFGGNQTVIAIVPNIVTSSLQGPSILGKIVVNATLTFYMANLLSKAGLEPNIVLPISDGPNSPWFLPKNSSDAVGSTLQLPRNIVRAVAEIYATAHSPCDEFWYASEMSGCDDKLPFREIQVLVDGNLIGVAWPLPIMYAGALNPTIWKAVPGIDALDIPPYQVDVTPFIGLLSNGTSHRMAFRVANLLGGWRIDGNLLLYVDASAQSTSGVLTSSSLLPSAVINQTRVILGTHIITTTIVGREYAVNGEVDSSFGTSSVDTRAIMSDTNVQNLDLMSFTGQVSQTETINTVTTISSPAGITEGIINESYPLSFQYNMYEPAFFGATVNSTLDMSELIRTNGTISESNQLFQQVYGNTGGLSLWVSSEQTVAAYGSSRCVSSCTDLIGSKPPIIGEFVGQRINTGILGIECLLLIAAIEDLLSAEARRAILSSVALLGGLSLVTLGISLAYVKYDALVLYPLTAWQFVEALLPELLIVFSGALLLYGRRILRRKIRIDPEVEAHKK